MKLTDILFKKLPKGHIYRGKYRLVKEVTPLDLGRLRSDYEREEQNMLLLRYPYLTIEQSFGHMKAQRKPDYRRLDWEGEKIQKFTKITRFADRFRHLKIKDVWE